MTTPVSGPHWDNASGRYAPCDIIPMRTLLHHSGGRDLEAACRHAMLIEEELSALYDQLTSVVSDDAELAWVFRSLRRACFDCHIPLFRRHLSAVDPSASAAWECRGEKLRGLANAKCCFLDKFPEPEHV